MLPLLLVAGLLQGGAAHAGTLYVNGVRADGLTGFDFENVDVRVDAHGDVWIDAPQYKVEVEDSSVTPTTPSSVVGATLPRGRYWLVSEDDGRAGRVVEVLVNGNLVRTVRSGQPQTILDLGPYLRHGRNTVLFNGLTGASGGGPLQLYVGTGANQAGTVVLDDVEIRYTRQATDRVESRSFTIQIP